MAPLVILPKGGTMTVSAMQGLEEIKVKFQPLADGWMGWTEGKY
jgi:hypothetical protein